MRDVLLIDLDREKISGAHPVFCVHFPDRNPERQIDLVSKFFGLGNGKAAFYSEHPTIAVIGASLPQRGRILRTIAMPYSVDMKNSNSCGGIELTKLINDFTGNEGSISFASIYYSEAELIRDIEAIGKV